MCGIKKGDVAGQKINRTVAVEFHLFFKNSRRESGLRVPTPTAPPTRPSPPPGPPLEFLPEAGTPGGDLEFPRQVYLIYRKTHEERGVRGPSPALCAFLPPEWGFLARVPPARAQPGPARP